MEITYDEYAATWQAPSAKESLDARISEDAQKRYEQRMHGAGTDPNSRGELANMTPRQFENLRNYQMGQLLEAYKDARSSNTPKQMWIGAGDNNLKNIRRVVGNNAGRLYNNGVLALDQDTVNAVMHVASLIGYGHSPENEWSRNLSTATLGKVVDEMISVKNILVENTDLSKQNVLDSDIYNQTDFAKRAIGKNQMKPHIYIPNTNERATRLEENAYPEEVGRNCFNIDDYELSWDKLMERGNSFFAKFSKVKNNFLNFVKSKLNPDKSQEKTQNEKQEKIGKRTIKFDGGER